MKYIEAFFRRPTLSARWLAQYATLTTRESFQTQAQDQSAKAIFHATDSESAASIIETKKIYGIDVVSSAHFHHDVSGAMNQAQRSGVLMGFLWGGEVIKVDLSNDISSHRDRRPNILMDVPISASGTKTWEMRLYPGTTGLMLHYLEFSSGHAYLLKQAIVFQVISDD